MSSSEFSIWKMEGPFPVIRIPISIGQHGVNFSYKIQDPGILDLKVSEPPVVDKVDGFSLSFKHSVHFA